MFIFYTTLTVKIHTTRILNNNYPTYIHKYIRKNKIWIKTTHIKYIQRWFCWPTLIQRYVFSYILCLKASSSHASSTWFEPNHLLLENFCDHITPIICPPNPQIATPLSIRRGTECRKRFLLEKGGKFEPRRKYLMWVRHIKLHFFIIQKVIRNIYPFLNTIKYIKQEGFWSYN